MSLEDLIEVYEGKYKIISDYTHREIITAISGTDYELEPLFEGFEVVRILTKYDEQSQEAYLEVTVR